MKLADYLKVYQELSGLASTVSRQAAFAGIALIWIFNTKSGNTISLPQSLLWPALCLIIGLGLDLSQYIVASAIWGIFHTVKENSLGPGSTTEITAPKYLVWPTLILFWLKLASILLGYGMLLVYAQHAIRFSSA